MELNDDTIEDFRKEVREYDHINQLIEEINTKIKPLQQRLKELKATKKELESDICSTMGKNDLKRAELPDKGVVLEYQVKKSIVPVNQKSIKEKLIDFYTEGPGSTISFNSYNAQQKASEVFDYIYSKEHREYNVKEVLKVI
jgi:hypothetical protein